MKPHSKYQFKVGEYAVVTSEIQLRSLTKGKAYKVEESYYLGSRESDHAIQVIRDDGTPASFYADHFSPAYIEEDI